MSEEYGNDFVTLIDEDGNEVEFEHIDTVEYNGVTYLAFIPAETVPYTHLPDSTHRTETGTPECVR